MDSCQLPSSAIREVLVLQLKQVRHVSAYTAQWLSKTWVGIVLYSVAEGQLTAMKVLAIKKISNKEKDLTYLTKNTTIAKMSMLCFSVNGKASVRRQAKKEENQRM